MSETFRPLRNTTRFSFSHPHPFRIHRRKNKFAKMLSLFALMACNECFGADYLDADNPDQALGMVVTQLHAAKLTASKCVLRYPNLQAQIDASIATWRKNDNEVIRITEERWARLVKENRAATNSLIDTIDDFVNAQFALIPAVGDAKADKVMHQYCIGYFENLANGKWKKRIPKAYEFLKDSQ